VSIKRFFKRKFESTSEQDSEDLPWDPADRKRISEYHPNERDEVRRKYLIKGPCQPRGHDFPKTPSGNKMRRFNPEWFDLYGSWLEYSVKKDKSYCLFCYLFRDYTENKGGSDAFVTKGFDTWKNPQSLREHVGLVNSFHNNALKRADDLMRQVQSIIHAFHKQDDMVKNEYKIRLNASIDCCRYLLRQGLPFRGHDESVESANRGNFLELVKYIAGQSELVSKVVLENAPKNNQMVSPKIQKDIVRCFAEEVTGSIIHEVEHDIFCLLVDESANVSDKKQMATSSASLKCAIDSLFAKHGLSIKQLRGHGYDGASNMKGEFNGLRSLILRENSSAYYIHCFAHQLQLVVVAVAKKHFEVGYFFDMISVLINVVGASCKRKDMLREEYRKKIEEEISQGEIKTGKGLNQELSLQRPGNTRWGSHYTTLFRLVDLFSSIIKVLEYIEMEGTDSIKRRQANGLLKYFNTFDFVFYLQLMLLLLGLTNNLSSRKRSNMTNLHDFQVECFYTVLDMQIQEFNDRFDEVNTELLGCVASLTPVDSFHEFNQLKVLRLSEFYPEDFTHVDRIALEHQLDLYTDNIREDERFANLKSLGDLARVMMETRKHLSHPQVYRFLKLVLTLPIATTTVERCFSTMKIVKTSLRNRIGDQFMNDCLVCFIERELLDQVTNEQVVKRFQNMEDRRITL
ncbi:hypothetical protein CARUB_v10021315mg, partial [Capsella rubella]